MDAKVLKYKVKFVDFDFILNDSSIAVNERKYDAFEGDPSNYWNID